MHGTPSKHNSVPIGTYIDMRANAQGPLEPSRGSANSAEAISWKTFAEGRSSNAYSFSGSLRHSSPFPTGKFRGNMTTGRLPTVRRLPSNLSTEYGPTPFPAYPNAVIAVSAYVTEQLDPEELRRKELRRRYRQAQGRAARGLSPKVRCGNANMLQPGHGKSSPMVRSWSAVWQRYGPSASRTVGRGGHLEHRRGSHAFRPADVSGSCRGRARRCDAGRPDRLLRTSAADIIDFLQHQRFYADVCARHQDDLLGLAVHRFLVQEAAADAFDDAQLGVMLDPSKKDTTTDEVKPGAVPRQGFRADRFC